MEASSARTLRLISVPQFYAHNDKNSSFWTLFQPKGSIKNMDQFIVWVIEPWEKIGRREERGQGKRNGLVKFVKA